MAPFSVNRSIDEVLADVGTDPVLAAAALEAEQARSRPRSGLVEVLERIVAGEAVEPVAHEGPAENAQGDSPAPKPVELVRGRWVSVQAVSAAEQGLVLYGMPIMVTPEQIEDPRSPVIPWDDAWQPDDELLEQSRLYDHDLPEAVPPGFIHNPRS